MKQIWLEGDRDDDHALADDLCWIVLVGAVIYFTIQTLRWVIR